MWNWISLQRRGVKLSFFATERCQIESTLALPKIWEGMAKNNESPTWNLEKVPFFTATALDRSKTLQRVCCPIFSLTSQFLEAVARFFVDFGNFGERCVLVQNVHIRWKIVPPAQKIDFSAWNLARSRVADVRNDPARFQWKFELLRNLKFNSSFAENLWRNVEK